VDAVIELTTGKREGSTPIEPPDAPAPRPSTVIEARTGWNAIGPALSELWRYRELLAFLTWRDVKVRYKQTVLGAAWAVIQPLATMVAFTLFLRRAAGGSDSDVPYPLFVFAGLLPWTFLSNAVGTAGQSLISNHNLVTKVYFPRLVVPLGAVAAGLVDLAVASLVLLGLMLAYGVVPSVGVLMVPLIFAMMVACASGMGIFLAALTVSYRDFRHVLPFLTQFWMFATPAIYLQGNGLGAGIMKFLPLNPAQGLIENLRQALLGGPLNWTSLAVSSAVSLTLLAAGTLYFIRVERRFADVI
jgi:lipopolysaccharide transport system permease protein